MSRVVITGIGALSPVGNGFNESWASVTGGLSGIGALASSEFEGLPWRFGGRLRGFDPGRHAPLKDLNRYDLFVLYAAAAAAEAVEDARFLYQDAAVIIGSGRGGIVGLERAVRHRPTAYTMAGTTVGMAASYITQRLGLTGQALGISNACASGASAIGEAMRLIKHGYVRMAIAGGAEAPLGRLCLTGYGTAGALTEGRLMRPFDLRREGFVLGEGAAVLVLEDYESALGRGARVYAEVAGYGNVADAYHPTQPLSRGQAAAMRLAMKEARLAPEEVDYLSAHATSTQLGDRVEAEAVGMVFGARKVAVGAIKPMTGHMLAASGAFEVAVAAMAVKSGVVPPVINSTEPEFRLNISALVREMPVRAALCNSFGFGGLNTVLALRAV